MDDAIGGGTLLPSVREDLRLVVALLRNASYTDKVGCRLYGVAAEFGRLAGWLAHDSDQPALAQRYFLAALRAAHASGDRPLGANILSFMSLQAALSDSPRDAITLAESALTAESELPPAVAALLHARVAVGAAGAGDAATWQRAQNRSFDLLSRSTRSDEPPWIYWFTEASACGLAGRSLLALGRYEEAERHLRRTVGLLDPGFVRDRAWSLCELATARLGFGSVDEACATASEAGTVIRRLDSARDRSLLADFRKAADPYARTSAVREFDAKYRELLGSSRA